MKTSLLLFSLLTLTNWAFAAGSPAPSLSPTPACTDPEFHQFDFWIGKWTVKNAQGREVGRSEISRVSDGCAICEHWHDADGSEGMSLNYYSRDDQQWHQDWVGGKGGILHLRGLFKDGAMILTGETRKGGRVTLQRITWTSLPNRSVEQKWESSMNHGASWQVAFIGYYWNRD